MSRNQSPNVHINVNEDMVNKIISVTIRPSLQYNAVVWSPHLKKDIAKLEGVQRVATRWTLRDMRYTERLQKIGPTTLKERRKRCDMTDMLFIYVTGRVKLGKGDFIILNRRRTRGHSKKLKVK